MASNDAVCYPRLLRRVRALLIDSGFGLLSVVIWWASLPALVAAPPLAKFAFPIAAFIVLEPVMVALTGGTPGHHLMGLRVESAATGRRIGLLRSSVRALFRAGLGWLTFVLALTTRKRQAIHDLCVGTVVVLGKPAALPHAERLPELRPDLENFDYPSKIRRGVAICIYLIAATTIYVLILTAALSPDCAAQAKCSFEEAVAYNGLWAVWTLACAALIVHGCHARLIGARRKARREEVRGAGT
jgi:uncharacterized RDD family membrane protein YckC